MQRHDVRGSGKDLKYPKISDSILFTWLIRNRILIEDSSLVFPKSTEPKEVYMSRKKILLKRKSVHETMKSAVSSGLSGKVEIQKDKSSNTSIKKTDMGNLKEVLSSVETFPLPLGRLS